MNTFPLLLGIVALQAYAKSRFLPLSALYTACFFILSNSSLDFSHLLLIASIFCYVIAVYSLNTGNDKAIILAIFQFIAIVNYLSFMFVYAYGNEAFYNSAHTVYNLLNNLLLLIDLAILFWMTYGDCRLRYRG